MPSTVNKQHIARAFSTAAARYDESAHLQRTVGHNLIHHLQEYSGSLNHQHMIDIGCGSGYFTKLLQQHAQTVSAVDLSIEMLKQTAQRGIDRCILGDAEHLPFADNSVDLCFSSLAVQWCNLNRAVAEMQRITRPNGILAIATLASGSLWQIERAWQTIDQSPHIHTFLTEAAIRNAFNGCRHVRFIPQTLTLSFSDCRQALRSLKNIGANHVHGRRNGLMGKHRWQRFQAAYRALCPPDCWQLDYRVCYIVATV